MKSNSGIKSEGSNLDTESDSFADAHSRDSNSLVRDFFKMMAEPSTSTGCQTCDEIMAGPATGNVLPDVALGALVEHLLTSDSPDHRLNPLADYARFTEITDEIPDNSYFPYFADIARRARDLLRGKSDHQIQFCAIVNKVRIIDAFVTMDHELALKGDENYDLGESSLGFSEITGLRRFFDSIWTGREEEPTIIVVLPDPEVDGEADMEFFKHEVFAVLAITKLVESIWAFEVPLELLMVEDTTLPSIREYIASFADVDERERHALLYQENLKIAAKAAIEASEAVNYAAMEKLKFDFRNRQANAKHDRLRVLQEGRHKSNRQVKAIVIAEWDRLRTQKEYEPNAEQNGFQLASWLSEQGVTRSPRVISTWLRDHAKVIGLRWR